MSETERRIKSFGYKDLDELLNTLVQERQKSIRLKLKQNQILENIENVENKLTSYELFFINIKRIIEQ